MLILLKQFEDNSGQRGPIHEGHQQNQQNIGEQGASLDTGAAAVYAGGELEGEAMDEREWLECEDASRMLGFQRGKVSDRKLRLFACACCRQVWSLLPDERSRKAIDVAERHADAVLARDELDAVAEFAEDAAEEKAWDTARDLDTWDAMAMAATAARNTLMPDMGSENAWAASSAPAFYQWKQPVWTSCCLACQAACWGADGDSAVFDIHGGQQAAILRDIIGNPFRPVSLDPAWRTPAVLALAQAAYDNRILPAGTLDPTRLAVLADALEEAGCTNDDILNHCRQPGEHVRGCWAVDILLGKE